MRKADYPLRDLKSLLMVAITLLSIIAVATPHPVKATLGFGVDDFANTWAPYGPRVPSLQFNYYTDESAEFNDFQAGHLDLTDWPLPKSQYSVYENNPDFFLSPGQGQYGMYGIDFNYGASTWAAWGCDFQHGTSPCGIEIREAFAHLIDRQSFVTQGPLAGAGQAIVDPSPPAKDPSSTPVSTQVTWDTLTGQTVAGLVVPPETSAFHIAGSTGGFAAVGSPDFCAARDHLIAANIGLTDNNMRCVIDSTSPGLQNIVNHPIRFMIRNDDPFRKALGLGLTNALNALFGTTVVQPTLGSIAQLGATVFISAPLGPTDDWDMYTFGWSLPGPFPDHLRTLYGSSFASDQCGGLQNGLTQNYGFACVPSFDTYANAASQTSDIGVFKSNTLSAFNEHGKHVTNIPVFARGIRIAALRSVAGLVNQRGASYPNFWTLLNAHNDTTYTPAKSMYSFGGGTNTLRWGQRQGTSQFNPFNAETLWEFNVIGEVYDTLLIASPIQPSSIFCWMCDTYKITVDAQTGNTHFLIRLRSSLRWQDGVALNSSDVKFSLLNIKNVPAASLSGNVAQLVSVSILSSTSLDIVMQGQSISHLVNLAGVPILPKHLWELPGDKTYGDVGRANPTMTSPTYDPINSGTFIGSGPYVCRSVYASDFGKVGTGCVRNADGGRGGQAVGPGGSIFLQGFDGTINPGASDPFLQYMRSYNSNWGQTYTVCASTSNPANKQVVLGTACPSGFNVVGTDPVATESGQYQEFSWADRYDNATVTIVDLADVISCNGKTSASGCADYNYWLRSALHPSTPTTIGVEVNIVATHMDDTWISPYSWTGNPSSQQGIGTLENITPFQP